MKDETFGSLFPLLLPKNLPAFIVAEQARDNKDALLCLIVAFVSEY